MSAPKYKRRYSSEELLNLRITLPVVHCVVSNLNKKADLVNIFRLPEEAIRNPSQFTCKSKALADLSMQHKARPSSKKFASESSEKSECQPFSHPNTGDDLTQPSAQWNFRRRTSSDRSTEPHSAPTGIASQKAENFQKFYRAVVSPTHVRVTAGGRIVPNNRSTAPPPGLECNSDRYPLNYANQAPEIVSSSLQSVPWPHIKSLQASYSPLIPGGFLPPPYNLVTPANAFAMQPMASSSHIGLHGDSISPETAQILQVDDKLAIDAQQSIQPSGIKISHPSQFDQTKPFVINGQVVYPLPPGFQPPLHAYAVPLNMLGNPNMMPPGPASGFHPVQLAAGPLGNLTNSPAFPNTQQIRSLLSTQGQVSESAPHITPALGGTSIPATEFLTSQLQLLRNNLQVIEYQIKSKSHQFNDGFMETQRSALLMQIGAMETALHISMTREDSAKNGPSGDNKARVPNLPTSSIRREESKSVTHQRGQTAQIPTQPTNNQAVCAEIPKSQENVSKSVQVARLEPPTKSRLSMAAALAPPFKPRSQNVIAAVHAKISGVREVIIDESSETRAEAEARMMANCPKDYPKSINAYAPKESRTSTGSSSFDGPLKQPHLGGLVPSFQRAVTYHGTQSSAPMPAPLSKDCAIPYLVGIVPKGVHFDPAIPVDILYSRDLTDEERRARYLYFGKAPRSVQSGLPKFDGKDFYPPSPVRNMPARLTCSKSETSSMMEHNVLDPSSDNLFMASKTIGYTTPSPIRQHHSMQNLQPVARPLLEQPIVHGRGTVLSEGSCSYREEMPVQAYPLGAKLSITRAVEEPPSRIFEGHGATSYTPSQIHVVSNTSSVERPSNFSTERENSGQNSLSSQQSATHEPGAGTAAESMGKQYSLPVTPPNAAPCMKLDRQGFVDHTKAAWEQQSTNMQSYHHGSPDSVNTNEHSTVSTVEIQLSPKIKNRSPKITSAKTFAERVENFRNADQQTLFLQNMLKSTPHVGTALSGTISSATAQGYLPQYRGSAMASLVPTKSGVAIAERETENPGPKVSRKYTAESLSPIVVSSLLSENRPFVTDQPRLDIPSIEGLSAEGYMRYLAEKNEKKKSDVFHAGPVVDSEW